MKRNVPSQSQISNECSVGDPDEESLTESQKGDVECQFTISRPVYNQSQFLLGYEHHPNVDSSIGEKFQKLRPEISCKRLLETVLSFIPLISWMAKYKFRRDLPSDIAGGFTIGVMNIPQGLAYALLAALPPITGLYTSFIPVLVYFVFGTSKHIAIGTFAVVSTMVGEVVEEKYVAYSSDVHDNTTMNQSSSFSWSAEDDLKLRIAVSLTLLVGVVQTAMGLIHLGFITVYLSRPLVSGFTTGAAFIVFTSQVKYFFGIAPPRYTNPLALPKTYIHLFKNITDTNIAALLTGLIGVVFLVLVDHLNKKFKSRLKFPIPSQLLVIIIGSAISYTAKFNSRFDVSIIDDIPKGLPKIRLPEQKYFVDLILDAFLIAIVAATTNLSLVKLFSQNNEYKTDSNQDLIAYGLSNIAGSLFSCFVSSGSLSRSVIQEVIGKTQIVSLISSVLIVFVLLFLSPLFEPLPKPILAAIVVVSLRRLFEQFRQLKEIWRLSQVDAVIWFVSWLSVVLLGIVWGLIAGFAITLFSIIYRSSRGKTTILGHVEETELYKDRERCLNTATISGVKIIMFEGPFIFVNAESLSEDIITIIREQNPCCNKYGTKEVIANSKADVLHGKVVEGVVSDGGRQITLKMVRSLNPMSPVVAFNNMGSDDFTEEVTQSGEGEEPVSSPKITVLDISSEIIHSLIIDFSSVTMIDFVGIRILRQVIDKSEEFGVTIYFAGCSYYIHRHMSRDDFLAKYLDGHSFLSIHDVVLYLKKKYQHKKSDANPSTPKGTTEEQNVELESATPSRDGDHEVITNTMKNNE